MYKVGDRVVVKNLNVESEIWKVDLELQKPRYFIKERSHMFVSYGESDLVLVNKVKASQIRTYSGQIFDYEDISSNKVILEDCLIPLSNICRFGGHTPQFYSVLNHSLNCYEFLVTEMHVTCAETLMHTLIHDFTEAYCGDMVKPLKIGMDSYNQKEEELRKLIFPMFGIDEETYIRTKEMVKFADDVMIANELHSIKGDTGTEYLQELVNKHPYEIHVFDYHEKEMLINYFKSTLNRELEFLNHDREHKIKFS